MTCTWSVSGSWSDYRRVIVCTALTLAAGARPGAAQEAEIRPISEYLMPEEFEIALARSAAPAGVSDSATIMVLGERGYRTAVTGNNGVVCLVIRPFVGPSYVRPHYDPAYQVPECLDAVAAKVILPLHLYRAELAAAGMTPSAIRSAVGAAFSGGRFQRIQRVAFSFMLSKAMRFRRDLPGNPHIMVYLPDDYTAAAFGGGNMEEVMHVEGGPGAPYTAAVIYREGIEFVPPRGNSHPPGTSTTNPRNP